MGSIRTVKPHLKLLLKAILSTQAVYRARTGLTRCPYCEAVEIGRPYADIKDLSHMADCIYVQAREIDHLFHLNKSEEQTV